MNNNDGRLFPARKASALTNQLTYINLGASVHLKDESSNFWDIFQDHRLKQRFDVYPELIFVIAAYKILQLRLPVYLTLSQGSQTHGSNEAHEGVLCSPRCLS